MTPRPMSWKVLTTSIGVIAYTYAGYPALLWGWSRLRSTEPPPPLDELPKVTLIVAAYDEQAAIAARLDNLRELDYPSELLEVLVVADGSTDATAQIARERGVDVLHRPERAGKAAALDRGVAASSGDIVVFSDANNRYTPGTLRALLAPFADPAVGIVTGSKTIASDLDRALDRAEGLYWRYEDVIKRWESSLGSVTGVAGEVIAIRRELYEPLPAGTINDDLTLALRVALDGWRIAYAPDAISYEPASATLDDESTRRARIVSGRYQALGRLLPRLTVRRPLLAWQLVSHKGLRPVVPLAMIAAALSNAVLLRRGRSARWLAGAQAAFYGAAVAGGWNERRGRRSKLTYLPYYLCRVNGAALRGLVEIARRRNVTLWERVRRGDEQED